MYEGLKRDSQQKVAVSLTSLLALVLERGRRKITADVSGSR